MHVTPPCGMQQCTKVESLWLRELFGPIVNGPVDIEYMLSQYPTFLLTHKQYPISGVLDRGWFDLPSEGFWVVSYVIPQTLVG